MSFMMTAGNATLAAEEMIGRWRRLSVATAPEPSGMRRRLGKLAGASGIRGVIFDIYGTLFVSAAGDIGLEAEDDDVLFRDTLERHGYTFAANAVSCPAVSVWRECIRRAHACLRKGGIEHPEVDIRKIWRESLNILRHSGAIAGIAPGDSAIERLALDYEAAVNPVWPMPGAREIPCILKENGYVLGIVSNAQFFTPYLFDALMGASLEKLGFERELCVWSYCLREAKPSVRLFEILLEAASAYGIVHPSELLYVGNDMLNDVWAAKQAGLRTALFAGDKRSLRLRRDDPRCNRLRPDAVLTGLADISSELI